MIDIRPKSSQIAGTGFGYEQDTNIWDMQYSWTDPFLSFYAEPAEIVDYTPDGNELIAGGLIGTDIVINQNVIVVDPDTGEYVRGVEGFYDQGASPPSRYWNSDYTEYVEVNDDGSLILPNGLTIATKNPINDIFWSPDDSMIASVEGIPDDYSFNIRTWDSITGEYINHFSSGMFAFRGLVWSIDSTKIAVSLEHSTGSNVYIRGLRVFSVTEGADYTFDQNDYEVFVDVNIFETDQQIKVAWNSDGSMVAVVLPDVIEIHELQSDGIPLVSLPAYEIVDIEWSLDDRFIVGGSENGTIRLWGTPSND